MNGQTAIEKTGMTAIKSFMLSAECMNRFTQVMGGRVATGFINSVLLTVAEKPELQACTPESIMVQAMRAATIRLSVDKSARQAYLGAVKGKAELIIGWRGIRTMAERTGKFKHINVAPVFEGEIVTVDRMRGMVTVGGKMTAPKVIGRVAYFLRKDGLEHAIYMTVKEIHDRARELKPGAYNSRDGYWQNPKWVGAMEAKDVLVILLRDWAELDPNDIASLEGLETPMKDDDVVDAVAREIDPTPAPPQTSTLGEGGTRTPEEVRAGIVAKAGELAMRNKTEADARQRGMLMKFMDDCFLPDPMAGKKSADVRKWLTGYATVERMPGVTVLAMLFWLCRVSEGAFVLDEAAKEEARGVWEKMKDER